MRRVWVGVAVLVSVLALPGLFVLWSRHAATRRLLEVERENARRVEALQARGYARPPVFDDPLPGDTAEDYHDAANLARVLGGNPPSPWVLDADEDLRMSDEAFTHVREPARDCAEAVVRALRRETCRRDREYAAGTDSSFGDPLFQIWGVLLLGAEAERRAGSPGEALRTLTAQLGLAADAMRGVEIEDFDDLPTFEATRRRWEAVLAGPRPAAAELEAAARALDRIEAALPGIPDALRAQRDYELVDLIRCWRGGVLNRFDPIEPSWKHLGSQDLAYCEEIRRIETWFARTLDTGEGDERLAACRRGDAARRLQLALTRAATAVAWYEAEHGKAPADLRALVPRYLPRVPLCALSGLPFRYDGNALWAGGGDGDDDGGRPTSRPWLYDENGDAVWTLRRSR